LPAIQDKVRLGGKLRKAGGEVRALDGPSRKIWYGLAEGKIRYFNDSLLNWSRWVAHRDATPVQYWIQIGIQIVALVACLCVAIFGWWHPDS